MPRVTCKSCGRMSPNLSAEEAAGQDSLCDRCADQDYTGDWCECGERATKAVTFDIDGRWSQRFMCVRCARKALREDQVRDVSRVRGVYDRSHQ